MRQKQRLKVIVLSSEGHLGSRIIMNKIQQMNCYEVCGIISAPTIQVSLKNLPKIKQKIEKLGWPLTIMLVWQAFIQYCAFAVSCLFKTNKKSLKGLGHFTGELPVHNCTDINDEQTLNFIRDHQPDLLISAYFPQILKKDVLASVPKGILNIHPGWLPSYKGAMSYFHVVEQGEKYAGVTVHWMDEGIDTGPILLRRSFPINNSMTQENVLVLTATIGSSLLKRIGLQLIKHGRVKPVTICPLEEESYFKMPTRKNFFNYIKTHRFFRIRDIWGVVFWRPLRHEVALSKKNSLRFK
jgi:methionyl-tRNA formyltransferase